MDHSPKRIFSLAGSAFIVLVAEPIFLLVDTAVVGHLGRVPLAALGAAGALMTLLAILGTTLQYGTTGRAARYFGAGRRDAAVVEGVQASWLAVIFGLIALGVGQVIAGPATRLIAGGPGEVADAAESWLRIAMFGLPGILLIAAANGWLRGVQDTRTPVRIVVLANIISAIACPILVYPVGLGLEGSAIANVIAQTFGAAVCLRAQRREQVPAKPDWPIMKKQLVVSRDLVLRAAAFQGSYLTAAAVAGRMGAAQLGAHQVGLQLWNFVALLLDAFAIAAQALVGAALGRGNLLAARETALRVTKYGAIAGLVIGVVFAAGWYVIPQIFTADSAVQNQAHALWPWLVAMMPIGGILFALDGVLLGAGDNAYVRTVTLLSALFGYIPLAVAAAVFDWGIGGVWAGLGFFIAIRFIAMTFRVKGDRWLVAGESR
ncbi:MATE family efflux transporter [Nakamurella antarctica]|uniref:MATE family efflux transporter n=1 Tax=Nakamurella antarctica TaxID=1902245 RepID=A0A3G8ZQV3_9ACTN|nr:MATE family efflux transporter [Nakamurella antarctica]